MTFNYNQAKLLLFYYIVSSSSMDELHNPINNNRERERESQPESQRKAESSIYARSSCENKKKDKK